jgi:acyl carrier protein
MSDIKQTVRQYIGSNFIVSDIESLGDDESLLGRGILDSTGFIELVSFLEETFHLQVADEEMIPENLDSLGSITAYVNRKATAQQSGKDA